MPRETVEVPTDQHTHIKTIKPKIMTKIFYHDKHHRHVVSTSKMYSNILVVQLQFKAGWYTGWNDCFRSFEIHMTGEPTTDRNHRKLIWSDSFTEYHGNDLDLEARCKQDLKDYHDKLQRSIEIDKAVQKVMQ